MFLVLPADLLGSFQEVFLRPVDDLWASAGDTASRLCHEAPVASLWLRLGKNKPFLRSSWTKKGEIAPEISFVNLESFEMVAVEIVLRWFVRKVSACEE